MSVTTYLMQHVSAVISSDLKEIGSRRVAQEISLTGEVQEVKKAITNESGDNYNIVTFWTDTDGPLSDFDVCAIETDADILIEFAADLAGTPVYATLSLEAGNMLVLSMDDCLFGTELTDGSAETTEPIERIRIKNDTDGSSTSNTANVHMLLFT